jgi:hypothetical protein
MAKKTTTTDPAVPQTGHLCVDGTVLKFDPPAPAVAAFLERVRRASEDPKVSEDQLVALIYGRDNPLLDHAMLPGHSMVTKEVFENPVYHVMCDYLGRKRVQLGTLDLAAARARFTMSVPDAAAKIGIHETAVRKAVATRRLASWRADGQIWLDPRAVAAFEVTRRGPPPRLQLRVGSAPGVSFRVKHPGALEGRTEPAANVVEGTLTAWARVGVMFSAERGDTKGQRFFVLEPGGEETELKLGDFYVKGRFTVVEKVNNSERARAAWKAFEAE